MVRVRERLQVEMGPDRVILLLRAKPVIGSAMSNGLAIVGKTKTSRSLASASSGTGGGGGTVVRRVFRNI